MAVFLPPAPMRVLVRSLPLAALVASALAGCDLSEDEPLAPGTFRLSVTGDVEAEHAGGPVWVAAPDSGLSYVGSPAEVWHVGIPIVFESSLADGDEAEVGLYVGETTDPNGPFIDLPEGALVVGHAAPYDPTRPIVLGTVRTERIDLSPTDGTLRLRRTLGGVEGEMEARYVEAQFNGRVFRGRVRLRFHAPAERPPGAGGP